MQPSVTPFHHALTGTWSYVVADPATRQAAVIDPVLDYDWKSGRTGNGRRRSHRRALSRNRAQAAVDPRDACARRSPVGRAVPEAAARRRGRDRAGHPVGAAHVQDDFRPRCRSSSPTAAQFDRLLDDDATLPLGAGSIHVIPTPGHTNDSVSFLIGECRLHRRHAVHARQRLGAVRFPGRRRCGVVSIRAAPVLAAGRNPGVRVPRLLAGRPRAAYARRPSTSSAAPTRTFATAWTKPRS